MSIVTGFEGLARFAEPGKKAKAPWMPPTAEDFIPGEVFAFDQSFTACGWVWLRVAGLGRVVILQSGTIAVPTGDKTGAERDLWRADWLRDDVAKRIERDVLVAYEMPPTGPGVRNPEVSLLCASAIRNACHNIGATFTVVHSSTGKKIACGNAKAKKAEAHKAMPETLGWIEGYSEHITNGAKRDALLVALGAQRRNT